MFFGEPNMECLGVFGAPESVNDLTLLDVVIPKTGLKGCKRLEFTGSSDL